MVKINLRYDIFRSQHDRVTNVPMCPPFLSFFYHKNYASLCKLRKFCNNAIKLQYVLEQQCLNWR